ncbi:MAG: hypothetical protein ACRCVJ_11665 [Clostridium sp.]|uniref:hypothetical protein n=1 Tax=Clostridium sp. TaxID=1506 RepID=UPI003F3B5E9E
MRLDKQRRRIWDQYKNIELMVRELGNIAQNDMEITDEMLELHNEDTQKIISELNNINSELQGMNIDKDRIDEIIKVINNIFEEIKTNQKVYTLGVSSDSVGKLIQLGDEPCISALADSSTFVENIQKRKAQLLNIKEGKL